MDVNVVVAPEFARRVRRRELMEIARAALRAENADEQTTLSIAIVNDREIRRLNKKFHASEATTDVLSFPSDETNYAGDIVISYDTARRNAQRVGWRTREELKLLVVHGVLHLFGYDDTTPRPRARMWKRQAEILGVPYATLRTD
jgi:probable rRNA maturation factor